MRSFKSLAVIGAGNMGSGIAQKMASEGFDVLLLDIDEAKVDNGLQIIRTTLAEGVERKLFRPEQVDAILGRIRGTTRYEDLAQVDLVVEAVFENLEIKREVFRKLDEVTAAETILGTNTSSFAVRDIADAAGNPERVVGLHYFYHPAKNRLVEVVPGSRTDPQVLRDAWSLQEQMGKTPIASADASGFVVNRFFVPWLNEAVRLLEENVADLPTIEAACKKAFGIGMGPFQLMNVTGIPIALHSAHTLGGAFGKFYAPAAMLSAQIERGEDWSFEGAADESKFEAIARRMQAVVFYVAGTLVNEGVGTIEDTDIGARVGLRWPRGPFQMMNRVGVPKALEMVQQLCDRWELQLPHVLNEQAASAAPFAFELVRSETIDGVARLTVNRPDAMNALNETVVAQLHEKFDKAAADPGVRGIVIAGTGKAFIAGADIRFFVRNIEKDKLDEIVSFTEAGHALLADIDRCDKPVIARLHGLALGGGLELALACDRIVATPKASLAFPETGIGIYPGLGGTQRSTRKIGAGLAKWLIYTGQMLGADEALAIGLVDDVVPQDRLDATILAAIDKPAASDRPSLGEKHRKLASFFGEHSVDNLRSGQANHGDDPELARGLKQVGYKAPVALRLAEKLIDEGAQGSLDDGLGLELAHLTEIFRTEDAYEGLSTLGKKKPAFKGQ